MSAVRCLLSAVALGAFCLGACGSESTSSSREDSNSPGGSSSGGGSSGGDSSGGAGMSADDRFGNSSSDPAQRPPVRVDSGVVDPSACESTGRSAEKGLSAVDIVWVIDGSGSMIDEAQRVQDNIDSFVASISAAGVDTRVILIAQGDLVPAGSMLAQSGNYRFVSHRVDSNNALQSILERYPDYSDFLRPSAHVHFIVVTDDESDFQDLPSAAERAQAFRTELSADLAADYSVHAIVSPGAYGAPPCQPMVDPEIEQCCTQFAETQYQTYPAGCEAHMAEVTSITCPLLLPPLSVFFLGGAFANGETYSALAAETNGVEASICQSDWTDVFGSLSDAVIESAPLPCNYAIPEPPAGMVFDTNKVNVKYAPPGADPGGVDAWGNVSGEGDCGAENAWYFDDPVEPSEVLLCPAACETVGSGEGGAVEVLFGCATIPLE